MKALLQQVQLSSPLPDVITYSAAVSACEQGHKPQHVLHTLPKLQLRGLLPKVITYSASISAYAKGLQPQHALHMLPKLQSKFSCPM